VRRRIGTAGERKNPLLGNGEGEEGSVISLLADHHRGKGSSPADLDDVYSRGGKEAIIPLTATLIEKKGRYAIRRPCDPTGKGGKTFLAA